MDFASTVFKWLGYGRYNANQPTVEDGQASEMQIDSLGNLRTTIAAAGELGGPTRQRAISVSDTVPFADGAAMGLMVLTTGLVKLRLSGDTSNPQTLYLVAGTFYRLKVIQVWSTGTDVALRTSGQIIAFYQ